MGKAFLSELRRVGQEEHGAEAHLPYRKEVDQETEVETGFYLVRFKTKFPPRVFDRYGDPLKPDVAVGHGSKIKVAYAHNLYPGTSIVDAGLGLYLQAVQVYDLVEAGSLAEAYGFDVEEKPPDLVRQQEAEEMLKPPAFKDPNPGFPDPDFSDPIGSDPAPAPGDGEIPPF